ncbi:MAG: type II toxin-antitoxin system VapC family toxin [Acidobacteriia bacterium]|nr:type II toxin-antitoxin system VapC family toxin [Terriglobia bacterium]MYG02113.1 type II toxin-antitoxin system VapC family toxin [Terriglobia bacterium]MYK10241.1 type II toxin-antitoxin system VapC family toxin [Terriglobia bacterium]
MESRWIASLSALPRPHLALELHDTHRLGRKRIADTLLAATLLRHGVWAIVACNPDNFAMFDQLASIDPLEAIKV